MPVTRNCDHCGTAYTRIPSQAGRFCSRRCADLSRRVPVVASDYRYVRAIGHPLAGDAPVVAEHRLFLYKKLGPGAHPCYRCGKLVRWEPGGKTGRGVLLVDHIDRNRKNNAIENLAPCCSGCNSLNTSRTVQDGEVHRTNRRGHRERGELRQCQSCGDEFVTHHTAKNDPRRGRFCSTACRARHFARERQPSAYVERQCLECGQPFMARANVTPTPYSGRYCSRSCGRRGYHRRRREADGAA